MGLAPAAGGEAPLASAFLQLTTPWLATAEAAFMPGGLMPDREAFATRQPYLDGVYSSLTWPANQPMCMHHELSYAFEFPGLMLFACLQAPGVGGVTGVADAHAVLEAIPSDIVRRFETEGWLLVLNHGAREYTYHADSQRVVPCPAISAQ